MREPAPLAETTVTNRHARRARQPGRRHVLALRSADLVQKPVEGFVKLVGVEGQIG